MTLRTPGLLPLAAGALLVACTTIPTSPTVMVLPGTGKTFEQFRTDDDQCRRYALSQVGGVAPSQISTASGVSSAVAGTAIGAAAGAALGGGEGAAIGAGTGLLAGSVAGADAAIGSGYAAQERLDISYIQCMYAHGHRVPVSGNFIDENPQRPVENYPLYNTPLPPHR